MTVFSHLRAEDLRHLRDPVEIAELALYRLATREQWRILHRTVRQGKLRLAKRSLNAELRSAGATLVAAHVAFLERWRSLEDGGRSVPIAQARVLRIAYQLDRRLP